MSNFVQGAMLVLLGLILGAILAGFINTNSYDDERTDRIVKKLDEAMKALHPKNPQYNIMHGYYKDAKQGEQPFRVIQVDASGYIILSRERAR